MKFEKTSIVLVNYNNQEDTVKCLKSIEALERNYRVILVDNNSKGNEICRVPTIFPFVTLLRNTKNMGFCAANNRGIELALTDKNCANVLVLNNDTTLDKKSIHLLEEALRDESIGIASPKILMADNPDTVWYGGAEVDWYRCAVKSPAFLAPSDSEIANQSRYVTFATACAFLIKREVVESVGGFDHRFFMYVEDMELSLRVLEGGWRIKYCPEAIVYHRVQGSFRNDAEEFIPIDHPQNPRLPFYMYHLTRNRLLTMKMHARGVKAIKFWTFFPMYLIVKSSIYLSYRRVDAIKSIFLGIMDFIMHK